MRHWTTTRAALTAGAALASGGLLLSGCTTGPSQPTAASLSIAASPSPLASPSTVASPSTIASPTPTVAPTATPTASTLAAGTAQALTAVPAQPLRGKVIVIDPGHNGANGSHAAQINRLVDIGNGRKACDTTGTQTNSGYAESAFTLDVATRLAAILRRAGATVVLTRTTNTGVGPCISERAAIGNRAHADAAISIHGDGAAAGGYGFHVIAPARVARNAPIVAPSARLALIVRDAFRSATGEPFSTYTGGGKAVTVRSDLGGLNLSSVPKIFIECANMRNAADARRMTSPAWRQLAATALAAGLTRYLTGAA